MMTKGGLEEFPKTENNIIIPIVWFYITLNFSEFFILPV